MPSNSRPLERRTRRTQEELEEGQHWPQAAGSRTQGGREPTKAGRPAGLGKGRSKAESSPNDEERPIGPGDEWVGPNTTVVDLALVAGSDPSLEPLAHHNQLPNYRLALQRINGRATCIHNVLGPLTAIPPTKLVTASRIALP